MVQLSSNILHSCGSPVGLDLKIETVSYCLLGDLQIVMGLKVKPKLRRHPKETPEPQRRVRRNGPLALNDFIDAPRRNAYVFGKPILGNTHGFQELLQQNLSGMNRGKVSFHGKFRSVIIGNFNIESISIPPAETDSPLVVYPDAVLANPIAPKRLQAIPWRNSKGLQIRRRVQHEQFHMAKSLNILGQFPRKTTLKNPLCFFAGKCLYHCKEILTCCVMNVKQAVFSLTQCLRLEIRRGEDDETSMKSISQS
jgi:hypothetical protein